MKRTALLITTLVVGTTAAVRAQAPVDTARRLAEVGRHVVRIGAQHGEAIWPGFRPDTIPVVFVLPSRGDLLVGWRGPLPNGYAAIAELPGAAWRDQRAVSAASTATSLQGRSVAQVAVDAMNPAMLAATAVHEAFHVFANSMRQPNRRFGQGENTILVSSYPVFDTENEHHFALEGRILAAALRAATRTDMRARAAEFVAVRRERHRRLPAQFAEFDQLSELHEGLAQYALTRALSIIAREGPPGWRAEATGALMRQQRQLENLTASDQLSLRFRFYQTGPAIALLLDTLVGVGWKQEMLRTNSTLQDMLGTASGIDAMARAARSSAERRHGGPSFTQGIAAQVSALMSTRRAKADSLLSIPGMKLVLAGDSLGGGGFNSCGYDPQNILQVSASAYIQMRWWRPCAGGPTYAEFNIPSVFDQERGTIEAVIGLATEVALSSNGQPVRIGDGETLRDLAAFKLDAPRASVQAVRADVARSGNVLTVYPKRPR